MQPLYARYACSLPSSSQLSLSNAVQIAPVPVSCQDTCRVSELSSQDVYEPPLYQQQEVLVAISVVPRSAITEHRVFKESLLWPVTR